jgi:hypothetical protein
VANDVRIAVGACELEVPVVGREPRVENLRDADATVTKNQCTWCLLAAMASVALDADTKEPLPMHSITI